MLKQFRGAVLLSALFFCAQIVPAQTRTVVTGTVVGTDGVPWTGAQLAVTWNSPGGAQPSLTPCNNPTSGCPFATVIPPTALGAGGAIQGLALWANASILPAGSTYTFTATTPGTPPPLGTGPQSCIVATALTIAGATQTVSSSTCPALSNISGVPAGTTINGVPCTIGGACSAYTTIQLTGTYSATTTSFTNITDGTHTFGFTAAANTNYEMECHIFSQATATTNGLLVQITGPASPTNVIASVIQFTSLTASLNGVVGYGGSSGSTVGTANTNFETTINFSLQNGPNAGAVNVLGAGVVAGSVTVAKGSYCRVMQ